jgi:hypothetical protein
MKQGAVVSSGYLPRFLVADVPSSRRRAPFKSIPTKVSEAWNDGICALLAVDKGIELRLSKAAGELNSASFNEFQILRDSLPPEDLFNYWLEKAPQNVLRVAALLHLADGDDSGKLSTEDMSRARSIVRVLIDHTRQLVKNEPRSTTAKGSQVLSAPTVLDRAAALFGQETFKVSELADRLGRAARGKTDHLKRQLDTLVSAGAVERFPRRSTGGRSEGPFYVVRRKKAQEPAAIGEMLSSDDASTSEVPGMVEAPSAVPKGHWLDLSGLADDETISVAELRAKVAAADERAEGE